MRTTALREEIAAGRVILFTGAGFSVHARATAGGEVPLGEDLADELWRLCFRRGDRDGSSLADLFEHARMTAPARLARLVERRLRVDPARLPELYRLWFSMPWRRVYTLNVDDLEHAAAARYGLPRPIVSISALRRARRRPPGALEVIHLNGVVDDGPEGITFSTVQYGERLASRDVWYRQLVADMARRPFLYVGTRLEESPLWQHLQLGPLAHPRRRNHRPRSFLVATSLTRARQSLLRAYRIDWIRATAEEFAGDVLARLAPLDPAR
jgi:hypothetical protein